MARGRKPATWVVFMIGGLLIALAAIVFTLGDRTVDQAEEAALTVPPLELPQPPDIPPPERPTLPTPGPT